MVESSWDIPHLPSYPWYDTGEERLAGEIRLSIFLIAGLCAGLPALVWALRVLYGHYKSGGRISALVIMLLLSDLLELLLSPYVVTKLLQDDDCWDSSVMCHGLTSIWSGSVIYGVHLQQVVALEAVLSFRHPACSAHAFYPDCSMIISGTACIFFFLCEYFRRARHSLRRNQDHQSSRRVQKDPTNFLGWSHNPIKPDKAPPL
ncbi:hypothetical protein NFI96_009388, partial [Prochilodus magdalenae]